MAGNKDLGLRGEKTVKSFLKTKGYKILETNFRTRNGEIDIIALEADTLVFIEVKTRRSVSCGLPEEAVDYRKQQQIRKVALEYLSVKNKIGIKDIRFDVASVIADTDGNIRKIRVHKYAF